METLQNIFKRCAHFSVGEIIFFVLFKTDSGTPTSTSRERSGSELESKHEWSEPQNRSCIVKREYSNFVIQCISNRCNIFLLSNDVHELKFNSIYYRKTTGINTVLKLRSNK